MRGATNNPIAMMAEFRFQSTRPMRGATEESVAMSRDKAIFQSTRPMRGATR